MKIIVDFDSTIADTHSAVLEVYRKDTGDYSTNINNAGWDIAEISPLWTPVQRNDIFARKELFEYLNPIPFAVEVLKSLQDKGHEIIICTVHRPDGIYYKSQWIKKYLPFINKVIYIDGWTGYKSMIDGDMLIDDHIGNLETSICTYKVCFGNYQWNRDWKGMRANDWFDAHHIINDLEEIDKRVRGTDV
jgi:5'(3')-deoxyribonucleotidase